MPKDRSKNNKNFTGKSSSITNKREPRQPRKSAIEIPAELLEDDTNASKSSAKSLQSSSKDSITKNGTKNSGHNKDKTISKNLLSMKFMQRTLQDQDRQSLDQIGSNKNKEANWVVRYKHTNDEMNKFKVSYDTSYLSYSKEEEESNTGRQSFGNFNQKIQAITEETERKLRMERIEKLELQNSISNEEMANRMKNNLKRPFH
ncbi:hypothetical protein K502DRAFT_325377 [Neoconidiobolus thromboides FSU 785]|nr:hypothetical protein K502DRAFT_325377 [Neoconidiobolus thromboides FSU 785]